MKNIEDLLKFAQVLVEVNTGEKLQEIEIIVLKECLEKNKKNYREIAIERDYSHNYIQQVIAPNLWKTLSEVLGEKVSKSNISYVLERKIAFKEEKIDQEKIITLESPDEVISTNDSLYIERLPQETTYYQELTKPAGLIRIKGPKEMGKTSLLMRIMAQAEKLNYTTTIINLQQVENAVLIDLNKLLRWFCVNLTLQLKLIPQLDDYWDESLGGKVSSTLYIQGYLLPKLTNPIVIGIEEINEIFDNFKTAQQFFGLIRSWHEKAKHNELWQKVRLILVQSTEVYIPLDINQSPFNVGLDLELLPFTSEEVNKLAQLYQVVLKPEQLVSLMELVNGHPCLVRIFLYYLNQKKQGFEELIATAATDTGIYSNHLHRYFWNLQQYPELAVAFKEVLDANEPLELEQITAFKLKSLGLVNLIDKSMYCFL